MDLNGVIPYIWGKEYFKCLTYSSTVFGARHWHALPLLPQVLVYCPWCPLHDPDDAQNPIFISPDGWNIVIHSLTHISKHK